MRTMLISLVDKFEQQTIGEEEERNKESEISTKEDGVDVDVDDEDGEGNDKKNSMKTSCYRNARLRLTSTKDKIALLNDSGRESDIDELEQLESMSYMSNDAVIGTNRIDFSSPPNLTSSPPLISDFDTNSCDSTGCESGITIGDKKDDFSDISMDNKSLDRESLKYDSNSSNGTRNYANNDEENCGFVVTIATSTITSTPSNNVEKRGAFRLVHQKRNSATNKDNSGTSVVVELTSSLAANYGGGVGEKRPYDNINNLLTADCTNNGLETSYIMTRLRSSAANHEKNRETLTAARRLPVKLIIHNSLDVKVKGKSKILGEQNEQCPLKRGRTNTIIGRPSLDFEKMCQCLVRTNGSQQIDELSSVHRRNTAEMKKSDSNRVTMVSSTSCSNSPHSVSSTVACVQLHRYPTRHQQLDSAARWKDSNGSAASNKSNSKCH